MSEKIRFTSLSSPVFTCMIQTHSMVDASLTVSRAREAGCNAFGYQQCQMPHELRTIENTRGLFEKMGDCPAYVTNYRGAFNEGLTDDKISDGLLFLAECGASLCDIPGDTFAPGSDDRQMTKDKSADRKQRELISLVHARGSEVLISSHVMRFLPSDKVIELALEQQERGADIVKIVTAADNADEENENLRTTVLLREKLDVPFLFLSGGSHCGMHRMMGMAFGCCMGLCVERHDELSTKAQPELRRMKAVYDNFRYDFIKGKVTMP